MYKMETAKNYKNFFYIHGGIVFGIGIISSLLLVPFKETEKSSKIIEDVIKKDFN